jgi:hypothetical protein
VRIGKLVFGRYGEIGKVIDIYGKEEFNRIFEMAVVQYADGDTEVLPVDGLKVY